MVWAKVAGYPYWPSLRCYRSGMDIAESSITRPSHGIKSGILNSISENRNYQDEIDFYESITPRGIEPEKLIHLYFFGDESTVDMGEEEARSNVVPYLARPRDLKPNMKHVSALQ